jgi:hypothetical protein
MQKNLFIAVTYRLEPLSWCVATFSQMTFGRMTAWSDIEYGAACSVKVYVCYIQRGRMEEYAFKIFIYRGHH